MVFNMIKVNNKHTRTTLCSAASIVEFEQVNTSWEKPYNVNNLFLSMQLQFIVTFDTEAATGGVL